MKATLQFDLDDQDDKMAHLRAIKSTELAIVLWEIQTNLNKQATRRIEAMEEAGTSLNAYDGKDLILEMIRELMQVNGIEDITELIN